MTYADFTGIELCDATASGIERAHFTWLLVQGNGQPLQLSFCAHHNAEKAASLRAAGFSPFSRQPVTV